MKFIKNYKYTILFCLLAVTAILLLCCSKPKEKSMSIEHVFEPNDIIWDINNGPNDFLSIGLPMPYASFTFDFEDVNDFYQWQQRNCENCLFLIIRVGDIRKEFTVEEFLERLDFFENKGR